MDDKTFDNCVSGIYTVYRKYISFLMHFAFSFAIFTCCIYFDSCNVQCVLPIVFVYHYHNEPFFHLSHNNKTVFLPKYKEDKYLDGISLHIYAFHSPIIHHTRYRTKILVLNNLCLHIAFVELFVHNNMFSLDP
jgi:hypothetical protein